MHRKKNKPKGDWVISIDWKKMHDFVVWFRKKTTCFLVFTDILRMTRNTRKLYRLYESIKNRRIVHTKWFKLIFIRSLLVFNIFCFCNNLSGSNEFITESVHRLTKWYNDKNAELAFFKFLIGFSSPVCKTRNNIIGFIHLLSIG